MENRTQDPDIQPGLVPPQHVAVPALARHGHQGAPRTTLSLLSDLRAVWSLVQGASVDGSFQNPSTKTNWRATPTLCGLRFKAYGLLETRGVREREMRAATVKEAFLEMRQE